MFTLRAFTSLAALGATCLITACQSPSGTTDIATPAPGETDYKRARYAAAVEGLRFEDGIVEVEPFDPPDAAEAQAAEATATRLRATGYRIDAIKAYGDAIRWAPQRPSAYVGLGELLRLEGKGDEALAAWRTALALDPGHAEAQFQVAVTLWQRGAREAAAAEMRRVVAIDPRFAEAHGQLAVWSYYAGDQAAAREHAAAAQALGHALPPQFIRLLETSSPGQPN